MILKPGGKCVTIYLDAETAAQEVMYPMARTVGIEHQECMQPLRKQKEFLPAIYANTVLRSRIRKS